MASTRHQGRIHKLRVGATPLPWKCELLSGFNATANEIDATCKDDNGVSFTFAGNINAEISVEWYVDYSTDAGAYTHTEAHTDFKARTVRNAEFGTGVIGDDKIEGNMTFTAFNIEAQDEEGVKGTATLKFQGDYTLGVYV